MAKKKTEHTGFRNGNMFCFNCGQEQQLPMPMAVTMFSAMAKQFAKDHKHCKKAWTPPLPDMSQTKEQRIMWWLSEGERGVSSQTLLSAITGYGGGNDRDVPHDPDDFRRCYLLLKAVPELRDDFDKVAAINPVWANLVKHWDTLTEMLVDAMENKGGKAPEMYQLMVDLRCEVDPQYAEVYRR